MTDNILINNHEKFDRGYLTVCDAVAETLGAEGKLVILENLHSDTPPDLTKDGVTVAQRIRFKDKFENFGAIQAVIAATQTLAKSGDNTTSCLVFAQGFLRNIERKNFNKKVEKGIEIGFKEISEKLKDLSQKVTPEILEKIAITSANNDKDLGSKVIEAYNTVGFDAEVEVRKNKASTEIQVLPQSGFKIDKGFSSPFFINNNQKASWEAENVLVVCLETWQEDDEIIRFIKDNRRKEDNTHQPMLFFMEKENGAFKQRLIDLIEANHIDACLVISPDQYSEYKNVIHLRDLALFTDGVAYRPEKDRTVEVIAGKADKVIVDMEKTIVIKDNISEKVGKKIEELKEQIKNEAEQDSLFTKSRVQRFESVSCLISVGGFSENDINEKFDRVDDALKAVKTAIPEGFIAGGGATLVYISNQMNSTFDNEDVQRGYDLIKLVIKEPFKRILRNANRGYEKRTVFQRIKDFILGRKPINYISFAEKTYGVGYNAVTDEVSELIQDGVVDSVKSMRVALESAKESGIKMLLTNVIVTLPDYS